MIVTMQDYNREVREILGGCINLEYTRLEIETGVQVCYDIYQNGAEIGKWIIDTLPEEFDNVVRLFTVAVARIRGTEASYQQYGDLDHIPSDELGQHATFVNLTKSFRNRVASVNNTYIKMRSKQ